MEAQTINPETATSGDDSSLPATLRHRLEYVPVWVLVHVLAVLPRPLARLAGMSMGWAVWLLFGRLRRVGMRNQQIAFPEKSRRARRKIVARRKPQRERRASSDFALDRDGPVELFDDPF